MKSIFMNLLLSLLAFVLPGCGGGGSSKSDSVSFYGDSLTAGSYGDANGQEAFLSPSPVQVFERLSGLKSTDYSRPGTTSVEALTGAAPFGRFADHIKTDASSVVVIRYGAADLIRGVTLTETAQAIGQLVALSKAQGKRTVLTGVPYIHPDNPREVVAALSAVNEVIQRIAISEGVQFIQLRDVAFYGSADMADAYHPNRAYSDRLTHHMANQLR